MSTASWSCPKNRTVREKWNYGNQDLCRSWPFIYLGRDTVELHRFRICQQMGKNNSYKQHAENSRITIPRQQGVNGMIDLKMLHCNQVHWLCEFSCQEYSFLIFGYRLDRHKLSPLNKKSSRRLTFGKKNLFTEIIITICFYQALTSMSPTNGWLTVYYLTRQKDPPIPPSSQQQIINGISFMTPYLSLQL